MLVLLRDVFRKCVPIGSGVQPGKCLIAFASSCRSWAQSYYNKAQPHIKQANLMEILISMANTIGHL